MKKNRRRQKCATCGKWVEKGEGILYRDAWAHVHNEWKVYHPTCAPNELQVAWVKEKEREKRKELTENGLLYHPFDRDLLPKFRALPGAHFERELGAWRVSLAVEDRPRIIELCKELAIPYPPAFAEGPDEKEIDLARNRAFVSGSTKEQLDQIQWLCVRERAWLNISPATIYASGILAGAGMIRPIIVVSNNPWNSAYHKVHTLKSSSAWTWPQPGEVLVVKPSRLPEALAPTPIGETASGRTIYDCNLLPESRKLARETLLIIDDAGSFGNHKAQRTARLRGLGMYAKKRWIIGQIPRDPSRLWSALQAMNMERYVFDNFANLKRVYNATVGYHNSIAWGNATAEAYDCLRRVCYHLPAKTD